MSPGTTATSGRQLATLGGRSGCSPGPLGENLGGEQGHREACHLQKALTDGSIWLRRGQRAFR